MTTPVHNARTSIPTGDVPVDVGRKTTSRPEFGTREEVMALYGQWLPTRWQADRAQARASEGLVERVRAGGRRLLMGWCPPLSCPADVTKVDVERRVGDA